MTTTEAAVQIAQDSGMRRILARVSQLVRPDPSSEEYVADRIVQHLSGESS